MSPVLAVLLLAAVSVAQVPAAGDPDLRWWKGNTHTHTLWSDGDAAPELIVDWYRSHDYDFLVLSDHNVLSRGERWVGVDARRALTRARLDELRARFGEAVIVRERDGRMEMRLVTLEELRGRFELPGSFLLIEGEEITDSFDGKPVHVNGLNLDEVIEPQGGTSVADTWQRDVDAVIAQGERLERTVLAHLNHPNFGWAFTAGEIARIRGQDVFEVYNGHRGVRNHGDEARPSTEQLWDRAQVTRLTELGLPLLLGIAVDDAHHYHDAEAVASPGRGWVMVRAPALTAEAIMTAMRAADFYASSGVTLEDVTRSAQGLELAIAIEPGVEYVTRFIGAVQGDDVGVQVRTLAESSSASPRYVFRGSELYVRAVVTSSRLHPNPFASGDREMAWVQPLRGPAATAPQGR